MRSSEDSSIIKGIGDDAAILQVTANNQLVVTTDTLVEGTHFVKQAPAYQIGYKLLASNLSDLAAMGARPRWATLNLNLSVIDENWLQDFSDGLFECADTHEVTLIGGDMTRSPTLSMSIQLLGEVPLHESMRRDQAMLGDNLYVTGKLGKAGEALNILLKNQGNHDALSQQQMIDLYQPPSRVKLAIDLRSCVKTAIDISDGLLHELEILCLQSQTGAHVNIDKIPMINQNHWENALTLGEDYELLFTANSIHSDKINEIANEHACPITLIGKITEPPSIHLFQNNHRIAYPKSTGYDHFQ